MSASLAILEGIAIDQGGARFPFRVSIGAPYQSHVDPDTWQCTVAIDPMHPDVPDIAGGDSFQAVCLACRMAVDVLRKFVERGGRITYDGAEDVPLEAYLSTRLRVLKRSGA